VGAADAGRWLALFGVVTLPGALAGPVLAARLRNPFWLVVGFVVLFAGGFAGLMVASTDGLAVWIVLLGVGGGTFPIMLTLINLRTRTSAGASSLSGFTQGVGYTLAGAGPLLVGVLYEATGGWTTTYVAMFVTLGVLVVGAATACRPVMLEDTWGGRPAGPTAPAR
jgi:CP family cyanate transporter-like MFS transporter